MKMKALSHYDGDKDTRFGDCILLSNQSQLIVYDCGHERHAETVSNFLKTHRLIKEVCIVISHNDADHTDGVVPLMDYLKENGYAVTLYTSLYLKHADAVEKLLDDGRRNKKSICEHILELFDHIAEIVETAEGYGFTVKDAVKGTSVASAKIVGPKKNEFAEVVAKAIEEDGKGTINGETVMNAASIQLQVDLDDRRSLLLCADATPQYISSLNSYDIIQFPHHGQYDDGVAILDQLGDAAYHKDFLISDNTGSGKTSGGSDDLVSYMRKERYKAAFNTQNGEISLPLAGSSHGSTASKGVRLGGLFT